MTTVAAGTRLGPYEIIAKLGEGGMGEVYRARDGRLDRQVAIKVLPAAFTEDAERLARFEREAKLLAQLHHPNIASIFGLEESNGVRALVMELVEGEDLSVRIARGRLPLDEALAIARQIAEALEAAHEQGIVHRDLKPANVKVRKDTLAGAGGTVKVLDFGLAKIVDAGGSGEVSASATITMGATGPGSILGTAAYMAPEQARGLAVDRRADVWAFGVVLYEMTTGRSPFLGSSVADTLLRVVQGAVDLDALPASSPAGLRSLIERCLVREPRRRLRDMGDARLELENLEREVSMGVSGAARHGGHGPASSVPAPAPGRRRPLGLAVALAGAGVIGALAMAAFLRGKGEAPPGSEPATAAELTPFTLDPGQEEDAAFLADGETLVYAADRSGNFEIYLQRPGGGSAINLTNHPADDVQPAVSPDGSQIAFASSRASRGSVYVPAFGQLLAGGDIWVMPALGGVARRVVADGNAPAFSVDGAWIYYVHPVWARPEIRRVAVAGGASELVPLTFPGIGYPPRLESPRPSPDGRWLLFTASSTVYVAAIGGGEAVPIVTGRGAAWDPSGRAIYFCTGGAARSRGLERLAFSPTTGRAVGEPQTILLGPTTLEQPAVASSGRRLVLTAVERVSNLERVQLDDVKGQAVGAPRPLTRGANSIFFATASPDGRSAVYQDQHGVLEHLWRTDEGGPPYLLTTDPEFEETYPRWSPDGRWIAFGRRERGQARLPADAALWVMGADGSAPRRLTADGGNAAWLPDSRALVYIHGARFYRMDLASGRSSPIEMEGATPMPIFAVTPDGASLVFQTSQAGNVDLYLAPTAGGRAQPLLAGPRDEIHPSLPFDGKWLYYQTEHRNLWRIPGPAQGWRREAPHQVTSDPETGLFLEEPMVLPDGKALQLARVETKSDLWIVELKKPGADAAKP